MDSIQDIKQSIMMDPANSAYTQKGWQPIFMAQPNAKILIIGPAPGIKTQEKGQVFRDKSGDRLRAWLGVSEDFFYESQKIAVLPLDFYFPGKGKTGDLPPRPTFAPKWHPSLLELMPDVTLTILMGLYAQKVYLKSDFKGTLTQTVFSFADYLPKYFPIVHSSPLNFRWLGQHPEFEETVVPTLQQLVANSLTD